MNEKTIHELQEKEKKLYKEIQLLPLFKTWEGLKECIVIFEEENIKQEYVSKRDIILDTEISKTDLPIRIRNCIWRTRGNGFKIKDLCNYSIKDLLKIRDLGKTSICNIIDFLDKYDLHLKTD
jgi:DNA-directed RNA polymerase alpha subunit